MRTLGRLGRIVHGCGKEYEPEGVESANVKGHEKMRKKCEADIASKNAAEGETPGISPTYRLV